MGDTRVRYWERKKAAGECQSEGVKRTEVQDDKRRERKKKNKILVWEEAGEKHVKMK